MLSQITPTKHCRACKRELLPQAFAEHLGTIPVRA
jgi:hypothetical protein